MLKHGVTTIVFGEEIPIQMGEIEHLSEGIRLLEHCPGPQGCPTRIGLTEKHELSLAAHSVPTNEMPQCFLTLNFRHTHPQLSNPRPKYDRTLCYA
jgi:hypothetical protein